MRVGVGGVGVIFLGIYFAVIPVSAIQTSRCPKNTSKLLVVGSCPRKYIL